MLADLDLQDWWHESRHDEAVVARGSFRHQGLTVEGGWEVVFRELDHRFPDRVAAHRVGKASGEAFGLK